MLKEYEMNKYTKFNKSSILFVYYIFNGFMLLETSVKKLVVINFKSLFRRTFLVIKKCYCNNND